MSKFDFSLQGSSALITGATGSIGSAITRAFLEKGANVVLTGTRIEKLERMQEDLSTQYKDRIKVIACNLSDAPDTKALFDKAEKCFSGVDVLVNNAGMTKDRLSIMMRDDDFAAVLEVNLIANFRLSRAAIKSMLKRGFGRIINIASVVGLTGNPGQANYVASKAGLIGLTKTLALEVATKGITINAVAPGFIESNMTENLNDLVKKNIIDKIPQGRMGVGDDVAACCVFLASKQSSYMTGQTLHPNGGMLML